MKYSEYINRRLQDGGSVIKLPEVEVVGKKTEDKPTAKDFSDRGAWLYKKGYRAKDFKKLSKNDQTSLMRHLVNKDRGSLGRNALSFVPGVDLYDTAYKFSQGEASGVDLGVALGSELLGLLPVGELGSIGFKKVIKLLKNPIKKDEFYKELVQITGDSKKAKEVFNKVKSKEFKDYFGDWEKGDINIERYNEIIDVGEKIMKDQDIIVAGSPAMNHSGTLHRDYYKEPVHDLDFNVFANELKPKKFGQDKFEDTFTPVELMAFKDPSSQKWYQKFKERFPEAEVRETAYTNYNEPSGTATKTFMTEIPTKYNDNLHIDFFHSPHPMDKLQSKEGWSFRTPEDIINLKKDPMFNRTKDKKDIANFKSFEGNIVDEKGNQKALTPFFQPKKVTDRKGRPSIFMIQGKPYFKNYAGHYKALDAESFNKAEMNVNKNKGGSLQKNYASFLKKGGRMDKNSMPCNKPRRLTGHKTKKSIVKGCEDGKEKIVRFGDVNMTIKKDNPERRKSFRARHNCSNPGSKLKARYWSCKAW